MSEALPLPPRLNLDYYRRLARELRDAAGRGAVHTWADRWITNLTKLVPIEPFGERVPHSRVVEGIEQQWKRFVEQRPPLKADPASMQVSDAQFFLARLHGFASWPRFSHHLQTMTAGDAIAVTFESAVDAIVSGDLDGLRVMLDAHPDLVNRRSAREHHSTLLHYVSANGVEDFRQRTPPNIVAITKLLLERGADVNAESEAYGGHSTTLGLTSTSIHPERAGVMIAMLELLLGTGANIEPRGKEGSGLSAVAGCLANGQGEAARFLAGRGALLTLDGAAGVNRADAVATFFDDRGALTNGATADQFERAVMYAAGYGSEDAIRVLMAHGANPNAGHRVVKSWAGQTPLHWTTYGPHVGIAEQLIAAGANVDARDDRWRATPLDWALHAWANDYDAAARERGYALIERLVAAGAIPDLASCDERTQSVLRADARMMRILARAAKREDLG